MARARNIKPGFFTNEDLAEIHPLGRLLFAGLWTLADREGRLEDRPKRIKAAVLPYDDYDIEELLTELSARGFILRYQVDERGYIWIPCFGKHQNPHHREGASLLPEPPESPAFSGRGPDSTEALMGHDSDKPTESPGLEPGQHEESPGTAPEQPGTSRADSPISDSGFLIPEVKESSSHLPADDEGEPSSVSAAEDAPPAEGTQEPTRFAESGPEYKLAKYLHDSILTFDPKARKPDLQSWAGHIDKMIRLDKRVPGEIKDMIDFARKDAFWRGNILSTKKLREKATTLIALMQRKGVTGSGTTGRTDGKDNEAPSRTGFDASRFQYTG